MHAITPATSASNADKDQQNIARLRRNTDRKRNFTDEELLLHIGMSSTLPVLVRLIVKRLLQLSDNYGELVAENICSPISSAC